MTVWTKETDKWLKKEFPKDNTLWVWDSFRAKSGFPTVTYEALKKHCSRLGLKKSRRHLQSLGRQK